MNIRTLTQPQSNHGAAQVLEHGIVGCASSASWSLSLNTRFGGVRVGADEADALENLWDVNALSYSAAASAALALAVHAGCAGTQHRL